MLCAPNSEKHPIEHTNNSHGTMLCIRNNQLITHQGNLEENLLNATTLLNAINHTIRK